MDDNTFNEYRRLTLPYQRSGNAPEPQHPAPQRMREQQAFPQRRVQQQTRERREQQAFPQRPVAPTLVQERPVTPTRGQNRPVAPTKMPKAKAQALVRSMKRGIVIASFLSFCTFSALVMSHTVGTTATQASTVATTTHVATPVATATKKTTTTPTATTTPKATATTTTTQGGGYGFGSSNSTSQPVSGTQTS